MKSQADEIALQGIEFWSTVCDEEQDLAIEAAEVSAANMRRERQVAAAAAAVCRPQMLADNLNRTVTIM